MAQRLRHSLHYPLLFLVCLFCSAAAASVANGVSSSRRNQADALTLLRDKKLRINGGGVDISAYEPAYENAEVIDAHESSFKENDRIKHGLPGQPPVKFDQYGGYVTVDRSAGRALFYYFVEADNWKKNTSPLVLWLNGGPGCSSLAYGAMQELGPFRVYADGNKLYRNPYSWNQVANVLFLESPAGVGFSYSNTSSDYSTAGDRRTASDSYRFLLRWFDRFPEYRKRDFYIAGESYAGHYVPQLAVSIIRHNKKAGSRFTNLKGILVGNPAINDLTDELGMLDFFVTHALTSKETVEQVHKYCDLSSTSTDLGPRCNNAYGVVLDNIHGVNIYNIYAPLCDKNATTSNTNPSVLNYDPCDENYVYAYLNRRNVQEVMHANITNLRYDWEPCSNVLLNWTDSSNSVLGLYKELMEHNIRVWLFSGDIDGRLPITSTQYSIDTMNLTVSKPWSHWFSKGKVGGYKVTYNEPQKKEAKLTLATVRGAGHMVPIFKPVEALQLFSDFLGIPLTSIDL